LKFVQELVRKPVQKGIATVDCRENKGVHQLLSCSVIKESASLADRPDVKISPLAQTLNLLLNPIDAHQ
jgi:hypothetical protein